MRGFWRGAILIWHVPGRAYFKDSSFDWQEGLNTLTSTVTFPKTDFQHYAVRPLYIHIGRPIQFLIDVSTGWQQDVFVKDNDKGQGAALLYRKSIRHRKLESALSFRQQDSGRSSVAVMQCIVIV